MKQLKASVILTILVVMLAALALSGCTSPTPTVAPTVAPTAAPTATPVPGPTVLTVSGMVNTPLSLSLNDLKGYTQYSAGWQNNAGNSSYNGTGPRVLDILNKAGLQSGAVNVTFIASDNFTTIMTLADLNGKYNDSIVAYYWTGKDKNGVAITNVNNTLQVIVPNGGGKNQAQKLIQITVS
jgi:hypothetical protein